MGNRELAPLFALLHGLIERGLVQAVDETALCREITAALDITGDESSTSGAPVPLDQIEHFEPIGLTGRPLPPDDDGGGAEALVLTVGTGDHQVAAVVTDRRHRPTDLVGGEVTLYDDQGQRVFVARGAIEIRVKAGGNTVELGLDPDGTGATSPVVLVGDTIKITPATDTAFSTWRGQVETALNFLAPGAVAPLSVAADLTGEAVSGSSKVNARD